MDKIIIADDHPLFRESMRRIVQRMIPAEIVEVSDNQNLLRECARGAEPTIMLLDLDFPGFDGARSIAQLRRTYTQTALIVVSMNDDEKTADKIMAAGANGYISKSVPADVITSSITKIITGDTVVCLEALDTMPSTTPNPLTNLSNRQLEILSRLGQGKTNKEIARELGVSPYTVRGHISGLFQTLGVTTRAAASSLAAQYGLV
ncbi:response regulator [Pseudophaeobacter arcticus]|uniref:response regulator transcription factor n=1 Tax=Pseudophaeobacter arcticus TaxID=385492 RepID=UPI000426FDD0|nr:response regulator transcription factor [Pseudophaeobacter arcticus]